MGLRAPQDPAERSHSQGGDLEFTQLVGLRRTEKQEVLHDPDSGRREN